MKFYIRYGYPRSSVGKIDLTAMMREEWEARRQREQREREAQDREVVCDLCGATRRAWQCTVRHLTICTECGFAPKLPNFGISFFGLSEDDSVINELVVVAGHLWRATHGAASI